MEFSYGESTAPQSGTNTGPAQAKIRMIKF